MSKAKSNKGFIKELETKDKHVKHVKTPFTWDKAVSGGKPSALNDGTLKRLQGRAEASKGTSTFTQETSKFQENRRNK